MRVVLTSLLLLAFIQIAPTHAQESEERVFLQTINDYRAVSEWCWDGRQQVAWPSGSRQTLSLSAALSRAAASHNAVMAASNCTEHTCPGEPHLNTRAELAGYPQRWNFLSENIAGGFETAAEVFSVWQISAGHNKNMLSCRARAIGIARAFDERSLFWWFWTTDFGDIVDEVMPAPQHTTLAQALDVNGNHFVDDDEITVAITYWVTGNVLPALNGDSIDDQAILELITLWVTGGAL